MATEKNREPETHGHEHGDVPGGWLRPAVFGAMDGLVTNASLIAGIGGGGGAARLTDRPFYLGALRQLLLAGLATAVTYGVGALIGAVAA